MRRLRTPRTAIVLAGILASGATVLCTVPAGAATTRSSEPSPVVAGTSPDRTLRDAALRRPTGLAVDPGRPTSVFTVDGSRRSLRLVVVGATGRTQARWTLRRATARHVTDIALGPGRQVWIGDIGDAARARSEIRVFRTRRPATVSNRSVAWSAFRLRYPDGHHDAQALLVNPVSGRLFVVTHDGRGGAVYEAPRKLSVRSASRLRKVASAPRNVTGGEYARTGRQLALTHGNAVTVYSSFGHPSSVLALPAGSRPGYVAFERPSSRAVLVGSRKRRATLLRVRLSSTSPVAVAIPVAPAAPSTQTLMAQLGWRAVQEPRPESITLLDPSALPASPTPLHVGSLMRTELRDGETVTTSGYTAHRAEVYGRNPVGSWSGTPSSQWPDPPGSTRWYDFSVYMPADFPLATDARWLDFTQWKGYRGGSPPVAMELHRNEFRLGGSHTSRTLGIVSRGWTHFTVGIHFSTSASDGWVEVYRDGQLRLPRLSMPTLDVVNGQADPVYLKQGIYRSSVWHVTQVLCYSPMQVTTTNPLLG